MIEPCFLTSSDRDISESVVEDLTTKAAGLTKTRVS